MAAGPITLYNAFETNLAQGAHSLLTDTIVAVLLGTGYVPNVPTDGTWANLSANELATGGGYTQGGIVLTSPTLLYYAATGLVSPLTTIIAGGSGYAATSTFNLTIVGGTGTAAVISVTTNGSGVVITVNSITTAGSYSVLPGNPAAVTGGTGTGCTLAVKWGLAFNAAAVSWASATITVKYLALVRRAAGALAGTDKIIGYSDQNTGGGTVSSTNAPYSDTWQAAAGPVPAGLLTLS